MFTSFSTLFLFALAAVQFTPSLAAPFEYPSGTLRGRTFNIKGNGAHNLSPVPLSAGGDAGLPAGNELNGAIFGRDVAALPGDKGKGNGIGFIGKRQDDLPDFDPGLIIPNGREEMPHTLKSNGIIFKRDDDGALVERSRSDVDGSFVCGGETGLKCPEAPTTAPGLPVPFRELEARWQLPKLGQISGSLFQRAVLPSGHHLPDGTPHITNPGGLAPGGQAAGAIFKRDELAPETEKRIVCSPIAGTDCSEVPSQPASVRILKARQVDGPGNSLPGEGKSGGAVWGRDETWTGDNGSPVDSLPEGGKGAGAIAWGTPGSERRALLSGEPPAPAPIGRSNTARRIIQNASRALNNGQIRAP